MTLRGTNSALEGRKQEKERKRKKRNGWCSCEPESDISMALLTHALNGALIKYCEPRYEVSEHTWIWLIKHRSRQSCLCLKEYKSKAYCKWKHAIKHKLLCLVYMLLQASWIKQKKTNNSKLMILGLEQGKKWLPFWHPPLAETRPCNRRNTKHHL